MNLSQQKCVNEVDIKFLMCKSSLWTILDLGFGIAASGLWGHSGLRPGGICCIALLYYFLRNYNPKKGCYARAMEATGRKMPPFFERRI